MSEKEKLAKLEEILELEEGELRPEMELEDVDNYDSMAKLSLIVLMDDDFGKKLTGDNIKGFKTVQDILDFMG
ncbi:MAG: acyl carrier protein [Oscillospiraceae bacterium]|nr:acyl carrier protein [Oscillospiraceae bacterium]